MTFQVATDHTKEHIMAISEDLKKRGFTILAYREADIRDDKTNDKVGEVGIVRAKGNYAAFKKLEKVCKKGGCRRLIYEGYVTFG